MIIGWKKIRKDNLSRRILSKGYNLLFRLMFKTKLHDVDCGFRCMTKEVSMKLNIEFGEVPVGPEIVAKTDKLGYKIDELPVIHYDREAGESIFNLFSIPKVVFKSTMGLLKLKSNLK